MYLTTLTIPEGENVINTCQITEINPSEPYVPTGATINEVDDNHCKSVNTGAIVGIVFGYYFASVAV